MLKSIRCAVLAREHTNKGKKTVQQTIRLLCALTKKTGVLSYMMYPNPVFH